MNWIFNWIRNSYLWGSCGLVDRALDLRLWVRISAPAGIIHDWGETLEQGTEPPTAPRAPQCRLPTAPSVCTWMGINAENSFHCWLYLSTFGVNRWPNKRLKEYLIWRLKCFFSAWLLKKHTFLQDFIFSLSCSTNFLFSKHEFGTTIYEWF